MIYAVFGVFSVKQFCLTKIGIRNIPIFVCFSFAIILYHRYLHFYRFRFA